MASYHNSNLLQQLASPSVGEFSLALLGLQRWMRGFGRQWAIGLMSLLLLLTMGTDLSGVNAYRINASGVAIGDRSLPTTAIHSSNMNSPNAPFKQAVIHSSDIELNNLASDQLEPEEEFGYFGLHARMTHYRLTQSRLSIPRSPEISHKLGRITVEIADAR